MTYLITSKWAFKHNGDGNLRRHLVVDVMRKSSMQVTKIAYWANKKKEPLIIDACSKQL